jgi:hypothetical protein
MRGCDEELCPNWSGDGNVCPCALFDLERPAPVHECFELDGARVHGDPNMSDEAKAALRQIVSATGEVLRARDADRLARNALPYEEQPFQAVIPLHPKDPENVACPTCGARPGLFCSVMAASVHTIAIRPHKARFRANDERRASL